MTSPIVSVCIPTYQGAEFLTESIESILIQNYRDFEVLILDDCSSDRTAEIARAYAEKDARVEFHVNDNNAGMVENWNRCLRRARGKYIKYLFQDDILISKDSLGMMVNALESDDKVSLVACARDLIDNRSESIRTAACFSSSVDAEGTDIILYCLLKHSNMIGEPSAVLFRKEQALRGFNPAYRQIVDLEMWFYLLEQGRFCYINEPLCGFRLHDAQQTRKNMDGLAHIEDYMLLFDEYLKRKYLGFGPLMRQHIRYYQFYYIWKLGKKGLFDRQVANEKVARYYGLCRFFVTLPFYKLYNTLFKYLRSRLFERKFRVFC